jgi:NAD(P)-dependent dehydrogenase (short-subunit alcohol dehydrogenase family)
MHTQKIQPHDLSFRRTAYDGPTAYARAKRGLVILTESWAKELAPQGIRVHAMHPGWVDTPGLQSSLPVFHRLLGPLLRTPDQGADTITWLAASPVANRTSGLFWLDRQPRSTHVLRDTRESPAERQALLDALERLVQPYL